MSKRERNGRRRSDVPGRVSCTICRNRCHIDAWNNGLRAHYSTCHPGRWPTIAKRFDFVDPVSGRLRCRRGQHIKDKVVYAARDVAWQAAFEVFALRGIILTPYRCAMQSISGGGFTRIYPGCGRWHLANAVPMFPRVTTPDGPGA